MRQIRSRGVTWLIGEIKTEWRTGGKRDRTLGEGADAKLRPLHVGQHADRATHIALDIADLLQPLAVLLVRAVTEIEAEYIDPSDEQRADHVFGRAAGAQRGHDLCIAMSAHFSVSQFLHRSESHENH